MAESSPSRATESRRDQIMRLGLVAVVLLAILGGAYVISDQAGLDLVGDGGVNAQLIPKVGDEAPELITISADGQQVVPLSALRGRPVWINFWGSWCQPCRAEMPEVIRAYGTLKAEGVIMLGVNEGETVEQAVAYAGTAGINFPIVKPFEPTTEELDQLKASGELPDLVESAEKWQVNNWPTHIFIDADGIVRAVVISGLTYDLALHYGAMIVPPGTASPAASPEASANLTSAR